MECALGVSTIGRRRQNDDVGDGDGEGDHKDSIEETTAQVLERLELNSPFFEQNPARPLPSFSPEEVEFRGLLGRGEFGVAMEVSALHVRDECPCDSCRIEKDNRTKDSANRNGGRGRGHEFRATTIVDGLPDINNDKKIRAKTPSTKGNSSTNTINSRHNGGGTSSAGVVGGNSSIRSTKSPNRSIDMPTSLSVNGTIGSGSLQQRHHRRLSSLGRVSFADDGTTIKIIPNNRINNGYDGDADDDSQSTISTCSYFEDDLSEAMGGGDDMIFDGEEQYLRGYMSNHCFRKGLTRYAVKRLRPDLKDEMKLNATIDLASEAKFLSSLNHPNIVKMRGTVGVPGSSGFMIVMDCLTVTLRTKIQMWKEEEKHYSKGILRFVSNRRNISDTLFAEKLLVIYDIARAMRYLHNNMIIFRDLKPENCAFDIRGEVRLFDFGLAKELKAKDMVEDEPDSFRATGLVGSRRYMAPEVLLCLNYGPSIDVYSYSILAWEVFSGKVPFSGMSTDKHFEHVIINEKRPKRLGGVPKSLQKLVEDSWHKYPFNRPTFRDICKHLGVLLTSTKNAKVISDRTTFLTNQSLRSRAESFASSAAGDSFLK